LLNETAYANRQIFIIDPLSISLLLGEQTFTPKSTYNLSVIILIMAMLQQIVPLPTTKMTLKKAWILLFKNKRFSVAGKIAAGKTTFLRNVGQVLEGGDMKAFIEEEKVDEVLLKTYINDQTAYAAIFQTERAVACHHRQEIVIVKMKCYEELGMDCSGWVERELYENAVFEKANRRAGFISEKFTEEFYNPLLEAKNNYPCDMTIYLHVSDRRSADNRLARNRDGEEAYQTQYLAELGESYFDYVLDHVKRGRMLVVDWTHFGNVETVLHLLSEVLSGKKKLPTVTFVDTSSDDELISSAGITKIHKKGEPHEVIAACSQPSTRKKGYHDRVLKALADFQDVEIFI
jgi:deoxyadenosine/deoxycytidine kinase